MKSKLFLLLLILAALGGCKPGVKSTDIKLKKTVSLTRPDSSTFTYSPEGKLISRMGFAGAMTQNLLYEKERVLEQGMGPGPGETSNISYVLNDKGQAISSVRIGTHDTVCLFYTYNAEGYKIEEYFGCKEKALLKTRVIENGNVTSEILYGGGKPQQKILYTYYDLPNRPTSYGEELLGYSFRGKDTKNLRKTMTIIRMPDEELMKYIFTYSFDDQNRVNTITMYDGHNTMLDSTQYYY